MLDADKLAVVRKAALAALRLAGTPLDKAAVAEKVNAALTFAVTVKDVNKALYALSHGGDIVRKETALGETPVWLAAEKDDPEPAAAPAKEAETSEGRVGSVSPGGKRWFTVNTKPWVGSVSPGVKRWFTVNHKPSEVKELEGAVKEL